MSCSAPSVHSVHFYGNDGALIDRLCGVVCSGLLIGNSVLMVGTPKHREELVKCLERLDVDVRKYARDGQFTMFDAEEMLDTFMVEGAPDPQRFRDSIGKVVAKAKESARSKDRGLTVFGEMVAVLWERGEKPAALALENLWNDLLNDRAFHLHCAYPQRLLSGDADGIRNIADTHSHVVNGSPFVV